jgi:hypothetical protein
MKIRLEPIIVFSEPPRLVGISEPPLLGRRLSRCDIGSEPPTGRRAKSKEYLVSWAGESNKRNQPLAKPHKTMTAIIIFILHPVVTPSQVVVSKEGGNIMSIVCNHNLGIA